MRAKKGLLLAGLAGLAGVVAGALEVAACVPDLPSDSGPEANEASETSRVDGSSGKCGDGIIELDQNEQCDPGPAAAGAGDSYCSSTCQVLCPGGFVWSGQNNHCYMSAGETATFTSATGTSATGSICSALGAHVVTFASDDEFEAVTTSLVDKDAGDAFWVGIWQGSYRYSSVIPYEPGWSPQCSGCFVRALDPGQALPRYDEGPDAGFPPQNPQNPSQNCVASRTDPATTTWEQYPCTGSSKLRVICEREPEGVLSQPCEHGVCLDLVKTYGKKNYVYVATSLTADGAEAQCADLGGTLAVLQSRDEREQLWHELSQNLEYLGRTPTALWIGLTLSAVDGGAQAWVWDDQTPADQPDAYPPPWAASEPRDGGTAGQRAYLASMESPPPVDDTLAHTEMPLQGMTLPYVCQFVVR